MRVVHAADVAWERVSGHRDGDIEFKRLLRGPTGTPRNYELSLTRFGKGGYSTPRHRHNYDQVRFQLLGATNFAPGKDLTPGMVGFFPEGTYYGSQQVTGEPLVLALQSGGISGDGFPTYDELGAGYQALAQHGEFANGVYSWTDSQGKKHNIDGYQAIWEYLNKRPMQYQPARYEEPILMHIDHFIYRELPDAPGMAYKSLGMFTEGRTELGAYYWSAGAAYTFAAEQRPLLLFVLKGEVQGDDQRCGVFTAIAIDEGEHVTLSAPLGAEAFFVALPLLHLKPVTGTRSIVADLEPIAHV